MSDDDNWLTFNWEDVSQIVIGAFSLAVPVSFSEESWRLGELLPIGNLFLIITLSISFLSLYAYQSVFQANIKNRVVAFIFRVIIAYLIAVLVVILILLSLNKFPIITEPLIAIKRTVVVVMPASMGAIVVDSFDKE